MPYEEHLYLNGNRLISEYHSHQILFALIACLQYLYLKVDESQVSYIQVRYTYNYLICKLGQEECLTVARIAPMMSSARVFTRSDIRFRK